MIMNFQALDFLDNKKNEIFSPTFVIRYAPLPMNNLENDQLRLTTDNLFELNKIN